MIVNYELIKQIVNLFLNKFRLSTYFEYMTHRCKINYTLKCLHIDRLWKYYPQ